jgi:histidyl-tRNA synthetase
LGKKIPAVGASIGVDRLLAAMQKLGLAGATASTAEVLVTVMEQSRLVEYQKLTRTLRESGINTELYLGEEKSLGKQLQYANRREIPVAVIVGGDEFAKGEVTIKNLRLGGELQDKKKSAAGKEREEWLRLSRSVQLSVPQDEVVARVKEMLLQKPLQS